MHHNDHLVEFIQIGELAETITQLLSLNFHSGIQSGQTTQSRSAKRRDPVAELIFQQARDHLAKVREGFVLSVRTSDVDDKNEIQFLLERVLLDWTRLSQELGLEEEPVEIQTKDKSQEEVEVERVRNQVLTFGMAAIALGQLPRLPANQITFPHNYSDPPTYADIPSPGTPGEMLWRIEELEEMVWQMMATDLDDLVKYRYGPVRRTYGFFETSAWLAKREAERFGVKKRRPDFTYF